MNPSGKQSIWQYLKSLGRRIWASKRAIAILFIALVVVLSWPGNPIWGGSSEAPPIPLPTLRPTQAPTPTHTSPPRVVILPASPVPHPCALDSRAQDALSNELRHLAVKSGLAVDLRILHILPEQITEETREATAYDIARATPLLALDGSVVRDVVSLGFAISEVGLIDASVLDDYARMLLEREGYPSPLMPIWTSATETGDCRYIAEWTTRTIDTPDFWSSGIVAPDGQSKYDSFLDLIKFVSVFPPVNNEPLALNYQIDIKHPTRLWTLVTWSIRISWESPYGCDVNGLAIAAQRHKTIWHLFEAAEPKKSKEVYVAGQSCVRAQQLVDEQHFLARISITERHKLSFSLGGLSFGIPSAHASMTVRAKANGDVLENLQSPQ